MPVRQHRKTVPQLIKTSTVEVRGDYAGTISGIVKNLAPGPDNHRMPVSLTFAGMTARLARSDHVTKVFNSAGTQQRFPMGLTGEHGKCGRDCNNI
ncbi:uncharacterized protein METZ01_LOCUS310961, partial [marine metagenome]